MPVNKGKGVIKALKECELAVIQALVKIEKKSVRGVLGHTMIHQEVKNIRKLLGGIILMASNVRWE